MLPTGVVGVIAVGVDGRVVRSAKARVPFLARFTGQGVESGVTNPLICQVPCCGANATAGCVTVSSDGEDSGAGGYARDVSGACIYR